MARLIHNEVVRIDTQDLQGLYRVIATSLDGLVLRLGYVGHLDEQQADVKSRPALGSLVSVARATVADWVVEGAARALDLRPAPWMLSDAEALAATTRIKWEARSTLAAPMLALTTLERTVGATGHLGELIRLVRQGNACSRKHAYDLWELLIRFGFSSASLVPRFDRCGAPGVTRPVTANRMKAGRRKSGYARPEDVPHPQRGVTESDRIAVLHQYRRLQRPGLSGVKLYDRVIEAAFVNQYKQDGDARVPVLPPQGTFPNQRQVRHIIESGVNRLERLLRQTTQGHFDRNLRGMRGRAYDGVPGPGHTFAIDSTVGDIYLRSAIHPAWIIGRPIVYVIVDVYSTAVVGFYICLEGPAWRDAKLAIFSSLCEVGMTNDLHGFEPIESLWPRPTLPYRLRCDRGEYLSAAARKTAKALAIDLEFAPPRRPDWKGSVEVLHRIGKDAQYGFLPGAFDARREELELRSSKPDESVLNLREYAEILHGCFAEYNLQADRTNRLTAEMMGAGVPPTPAGLWRFGHEAGFGNLRATSQDLLAAELLPRGNAVIRRNGLYFESLEYAADADTMQMWTGQARNVGVIDLPVYYYPNSTSRIWWNDPQAGLSALMLRGNARAPSDITLYDWRDALMAERRLNDERQYQRLQASLESMAKRQLIVEQATRRTRDAEAETPAEAIPGIRDARRFERTARSTGGTETAISEVVETEPEAPSEVDRHADLLDSYFADMNRDGHA